MDRLFINGQMDVYTGICLDGWIDLLGLARCMDG